MDSPIVFAFLCSTLPVTFQYFYNKNRHAASLLKCSVQPLECDYSGDRAVGGVWNASLRQMLRASVRSGPSEWLCHRFCHLSPPPQASPEPTSLQGRAGRRVFLPAQRPHPSPGPPHLVQVHIFAVRKVERGDEHPDTVTHQPIPIQVLHQHPCHEVLACARPAVERQSKGLVWLGRL